MSSDMGSGIYPHDAVREAVARTLLWGRDRDVAIEVGSLDPRDASELLITWHRMADHLSYEPHDLITYYNGKTLNDLAPILRAVGVRVVDYDALVRSFT